MSKKKATMTLKDFHGGSIPSDLSLPSSPGVIVRNSDRIGLDRPSAWGNPIGKPDHRLRPGSANGVRNFDDKTPFLTHTSHIGRNFDEDERTPLDGVSAPRRTVSDESIRPEQKVDYAVQSSGRPCSNHGGASYAARFGGLAPNAWGLRKDVVAGVQEKVLPVAAKLAHEKVSLGRWHSKQVSGGHAADVEVIRHTEIESESLFQGYGRSGDVGVQVGREALVRKTEQSLSVDDGSGSWVGGKEMPVYERARSPLFSEIKERSHPVYGDGHHSPRNVGKLGGPELQPAESLERPRLKLLPRSSPLENVEPFPVDYKQQQQKLSTGHVEYVRETHRKGSVYKPGPAGSEIGSPVTDRPKFSLKPRSQPPEQLESNVETKRNTLFGGARPRELVLKERGIDDVVMSNHEVGHPSIRTKQDVSRGDTLQVRGTPLLLIEKADIGSLDHKSGKYIDRRDHWADVDKSDMQRRNWRSENQRSSRDLEKQSQHVERPPSPETWRKPVEQPESASGQCCGKAASPLELTNIFSRSISDPKTADRLSGQRGTPSRGQVPFSRLTTGPLTQDLR